MKAIELTMNRIDVFQHIRSLCQNDGTFGFSGYELDDIDFDKIVITDLQLSIKTLDGKMPGAVIGTIRLLPKNTNTVAMFVDKDAIWHRDIPNGGAELFARFFTRVSNYFDNIGALLKSEKRGMQATNSDPDTTHTGNQGCILIVTVTEIETKAVLDSFLEDQSDRLNREHIGNKTYYSLGKHGGSSVVLVQQSGMGTSTPGGALLTIEHAIKDLQPQAVIMCGIAFGLRPSKQKLGDILISRQLRNYEIQKVDRRYGTFPRGDCVTASTRLLDRFQSGIYEWHGASPHFGLIMSGEKLVNDPVFRDALLQIEPEAIGGEMEGAGLYAASQESKVDWILVKAICDWADGNKDDKAQENAAYNAAKFLQHVIEIGGWDNPAKREVSKQNQFVELLNIAKEIEKEMNESLIENQKILAPLFHNPATRHNAYREMEELYNNQRSRGSFGRWDSYLEELNTKETNPQISRLIENLRRHLRNLHHSFYTKRPSKFAKRSILMLLGDETITNNEEIIISVEEYLDNLRSIIEHIGAIVGRLSAFSESK